jgi:phosphoribosylamine---glycine ligase
MKSDLLPALVETIDGKIKDVPIELDDRIAVTIIIASGGYPGKYETGKPISGLDCVRKLPDVFVFHAGTKRQNSEIVSAGGRVLAVTALGDSVTQARDRAYAAVGEIHFDGCRFRRDIALASAKS